MRNCIEIFESGGKADFFNLSKAINYIADAMPNIEQKNKYPPKKKYDKKILSISKKFYSNQTSDNHLGFYQKRKYVISILKLNGITIRQIRAAINRKKGLKHGEYIYTINLKLYDKIVVLIYDFLHKLNCIDQINALYQNTLKYGHSKSKDIINVFIPRQYALLDTECTKIKESDGRLKGGFYNFFKNKPTQELLKRLNDLKIEYSVII